MEELLHRIKRLFEALMSTSSRIEKENILKEFKDDDDVKEVLNFIFNPYIVTGVSTGKASKYKDAVIEMDFLDEVNHRNIELALEYFKTHNTGRDEDLIELAKYANANSYYKDIVYNIITKNVKLGIQANTLNKVFGKGFIPTFDVMLAEKYFDNPDKLLPDGTEFILTTKLDGVRCVLVNRSILPPQFYSRQGLPFDNLTELIKEAYELPADFVYDGELLLNIDGLESKDLYRETMKVVSSDGEKVNVIFNVFDMMPISDFMSGKCDVPCYERKEYVKQIANTEHIKEVKCLYRGTDKSQIDYYLDKITSEGGEGVMINIANAPYECKRTKNLLKVKKMQTADVKVIALEPGTGRNFNKLGALLVEFIGPDGNIYTCSVGSGLTDEDRDRFWNHPELVEGKIIEIQYFEISSNQNGTYSLRFPVFKYIRDDKTDISMY